MKSFNREGTQRAQNVPTIGKNQAGFSNLWNRYGDEF